MSIYLVDYENVNADGFRGIEKLGKNDSVYVFLRPMPVIYRLRLIKN